MGRKKINIDGVGEFPLRKWSWHGFAVQAILLMGLWLLLSGHYDLFHISLGIFSVFVVMSINARINQIQFFHRDVPEWERIKIVCLIRYLPWLLWKIFVASMQVAYVVLHRRMPIHPVLLKFKVKLPNVGAQVILGNSITLTPGTITIDIKGNEFLVHALIPDSYAGLVDGTMPRRVAELFGKSPPKDIVSDIEIIKSREEMS